MVTKAVMVAMPLLLFNVPYLIPKISSYLDGAVRENCEAQSSYIYMLLIRGY